MPQVVGGALKNMAWYQVQGGLLVPVKQGLQVIGGAYKEFYSAGVSVTLANSTNVDISSLFAPADWADAGLAKKVIVPAGVTIGSNDNTLPAMRSGTGRAGQLVVELSGAILGAGGTLAHPIGGDAFLAEQAGIVFTGDGDIWSGGGLGGLGGTGGQGSYDTAGSEYQAVYDSYAVVERTVNDVTTYTWKWAGVTLATSGGFSSPVVSGAYSYSSPPSGWSNNGAASGYNYWHGLTKSGTFTYYQAGGLPGTQGRGQGFDGNLALGTAGASGINNAGDGGASGDGGGFGAQGDPGSDGVDGNYGVATAGSAGALPGFAITNIGNVTVTGTPSVLGQ